MNQHESSSEQAIGEIDLLQMLKKWVTYTQANFIKIRRYLSMALVICALLVVARLIYAPPMTAYSEVVSFTFPQSEKGKYPNGSDFSVSDLVNRTVLESVWRENKLESQGMSLADLEAAVSIVPYADNEMFIRSKYQGMLARKNLSTADISSMERDFRLELEGHAKKNALLSLTVPFSSSISGSLAIKIIRDIPETWSKQAIQQLGVVSMPVADGEAVKDEVLKKGSPFQIVDYFYKSADGLALTLNRISAYPGGDTLKDPETGLSVEDLKHQVAELNRYWVLDFDNYVQQRNQASEIDIRSAEIRLKELQEKKQEYLAEAKTYKLALADYDALKQSQSLNDPVSRNQQNASGMQLQGDALQKLIDIGGQNKDSEFRQEMVKKRVDADLKANAMDQEIMRLDRRILAARKVASKSAVDPEKMAFYTSEIWTQFLAISGGVKRIHAVQSNKFSDGNGQLFSAGGVSKSFATTLGAMFYVPVALMVMLALLFVLICLIGRKGGHR